MMTSVKTTVFLHVALCCLAETDQHLRGASCLDHEGDEQHPWRHSSSYKTEYLALLIRHLHIFYSWIDILYPSTSVQDIHSNHFCKVL